MNDNTIIGCVTAVVIIVSFLIFIGFLSVNSQYYNMMTRCLESNGSWVLDGSQRTCRINGVCPNGQ